MSGRGPLVCRGPRAAEARLLARLDELAGEAAREPALLGRPVRVVVPSRSLRDHLAGALLRRRGRAVAGIAVDTLYAVAVEILERAGETPPRGAVALEVLARRFAARMPALSRALAGLADGFGSVVGAVRDLLDAGFTGAHLEAAAEQLTEVARGGLAAPRQAERAGDLLRVTAACSLALTELAAGRPADAYARAAELLAREPELLPARALFIHGFADATGVALDLLEGLLALSGATLLLDLPPDPAGEEAAGAAFADRLARRLAGRPVADLLAAAEPGGGKAPESELALPEIALVEAGGAYAEAREAALRIRELLAAGARPEGIGVVARDLGPYRLPLDQAFRRLGVPFSAPGTPGSPGEAEQRLAALAELLQRRSRVAADRWLAAARPVGAGARGVDLRLGLRALGAARLADVAALEVEELLAGADGLALPVRRGGRPHDDELDDAEPDGVEPDDAEEEEGETRGTPLRRRRLSRESLERGVTEARSLAAHLEAWPREAPLVSHLDRVRELLRKHLRWRSEEGPGSRAWVALAVLEEELPGSWTVTADDLALLLARVLERQAGPALGGEGGGVQVRSVVEARGRTWDHLFVLGLNRDRFPRRVPEDPLLPDPLRGALATVLPDVPVKARGHLEERYLFAQLLASAPRVTLSWLTCDDDGLPLAPSPLLDRLRLERRDLLGEPRTARHPHQPLAGEDGRPRPAHEAAVLAGLEGGRKAFAAALPAALAEGGWAEPGELARTREAILAELDAAPWEGTGRRLGPYLGLVGPMAESGELYVTRLEGLARCSWQAFLLKDLRLEPSPDPLATLSGLDPRLVGIAVHAVLERLVAEAVAGETPAPAGLAGALGRPPVRVSWPPPPRLDALVAESCRRVAREEGVPLLARALAARVRPFLAVAAREGLGEGFLAYGAELEGFLEVEGRHLAFRADLAQEVTGDAGKRAGEVLLLTDFKTGKPLSDKKQEETRRRHFLEGVARGRYLQAVAYAGAAAGRPATGRYLFLGRPEEGELPRVFDAAPEDGELGRRFGETVAVLLAARQAGALTPRLVDESLDNRGPACRYCEVVEACLQEDSGALRRLARWIRRGREGGESHPLAAAALAVLRLPDKESSGAETSSAPTEGRESSGAEASSAPTEGREHG